MALLHAQGAIASSIGESKYGIALFLLLFFSLLVSPMCALSALDAEASGLSFREPLEMWRFRSEAGVGRAIRVSDGGAVVSARWSTPDGEAKPGGKAILRIKEDGSIAWKYSGSEAWRVVLQDATPDGKLVLAALISRADPTKMKLAVLDDTGKVVKETEPMGDSNWVWLSPDGELLLRWDNEVKTLILEELMSGKRIWSLEDVQPPVRPMEVDFVQPVLQAGYVLLGDEKRGIVAGIDIRGKHLWRINRMKWYAPPTSPVVASADGRWLAAKSGEPACESMLDVEPPGDGGAVAPPPSLVDLDDTIALLEVVLGSGRARVPRDVRVVWRRAMKLSRIQGRRIPRRGLHGGAVIHIDLFAPEVEDEAPPSLTILTEMGVTTYHFNGRGVPERETAWPVCKPRGMFEAWLLPSGHLLVERRASVEGPRALQIVDQAGKVLWDMKPEEEIFRVSFDKDRRYMMVEMLRELRAYRLE